MLNKWAIRKACLSFFCTAALAAGASYTIVGFSTPSGFGRSYFQRGAGRSRPHLCFEKNTTGHLVQDLERIRALVDVDGWIVVGGSWGSTLALSYAETYPDRVRGLVLRAVFLGTAGELDWAFIEGPKRFRPDLYAELASFLEPYERADILGSYMRRLGDPDPAIHEPAAAIWYAAERVLSQSAPRCSAIAGNLPPSGVVPPTPLMQAHYFPNQCFLHPGELLANADLLSGIPGAVIQGRYDLLCPPTSAYALSRVWPGCQLTFVEGAGHSMSEPGTTEAIVRAVGLLADR
jgi:proline iminopeptidase